MSPPSRSLMPSKAIEKLTEGEAVRWLDDLSVFCVSRPEAVQDELKDVVAGLCMLLKMKIHFSQKVGAADTARQDSTNAQTTACRPPNPLYSSLFQAIASITKYAGASGCIPRTSELLLGLMALAAVTPSYSQSAFIAAKAVLRQADAALFSVEGYSQQIHAWMLEALLRGDETTSTPADTESEESLLVANSTVEEQKMAFNCLDRMLRGKVTLLVAVGGDEAQLRRHARHEARFTAMILELLNLVETQVVPALQERNSKIAAATSEGAPNGMSPPGPMNSTGTANLYYLAVAQDFCKRVYRAHLVQHREIEEMSRKTLASKAPQDVVSLSNRKMVVAPKVSRRPQSTGVSRTASSVKAKSLADSTSTSSTTLNSTSVDAESAPPVSSTLLQAGTMLLAKGNRDGEHQKERRGRRGTGTAQSPPPPSRELFRTNSSLQPKVASPIQQPIGLAEAREIASGAIDDVSKWPKKSVVLSNRVVPVLHQYKEGREVEMEILSTQLAALKKSNNEIAAEIHLNEQVIALCIDDQNEKSKSPSDPPAPEEIVVDVHALVSSLQGRVADLEGTVRQHQAAREQEVAQLHQTLQDERSRGFILQQRLKEKYGNEIAQQAQELAMLQATGASHHTPPRRFSQKVPGASSPVGQNGFPEDDDTEFASPSKSVLHSRDSSKVDPSL